MSLAQPLVHTLGIGFKRLAAARLDDLQVAQRGAVVAHGALEFVDGEGGVAQDLAQPAGADAAVHLHLPQAVLRVDIAQPVEGIVVGAGEDVRHAVRVAHDLDGAVDAGDAHGAGGQRQTGAQPEVAA